MIPYSVEEIYGLHSSGKYQKSKLNPAYLHEKNKKQIVESMEGVKLYLHL